MNSGSGSAFGSGFDIKWDDKRQKIKNEYITFWATMLLLTLK
jgi:hypothetical protein